MQKMLEACEYVVWQGDDTQRFGMRVPFGWKVWDERGHSHVISDEEMKEIEQSHDSVRLVKKEEA